MRLIPHLVGSTVEDKIKVRMVSGRATIKSALMTREKGFRDHRPRKLSLGPILPEFVENQAIMLPRCAFPFQFTPWMAAHVHASVLVELKVTPVMVVILLIFQCPMFVRSLPKVKAGTTGLGI